MEIDLSKVAKFFADEWAVIWSAPFTFLAALAIGWLIIWRLTKSHYLERINAKDAQIALLTLRVQYAEKQVDGLLERIKEQDPAVPPQVDALRAAPPQVLATFREVAEQGKIVVGSGDITTSANAFSLQSIGLTNVEPVGDALEVTLGPVAKLVLQIVYPDQKKG